MLPAVLQDGLAFQKDVFRALLEHKPLTADPQTWGKIAINIERARRITVSAAENCRRTASLGYIDASAKSACYIQADGLKGRKIESSHYRRPGKELWTVPVWTAGYEKTVQVSCSDCVLERDLFYRLHLAIRATLHTYRIECSEPKLRRIRYTKYEQDLKYLCPWIMPPKETICWTRYPVAKITLPKR